MMLLMKPRGILEALLVADVAEKAWESRRYRRIKTNLINSARRPGVKRLLESLIECSRELDYRQRETEIYRLTEQWFSDESDKNEVLQILERFGLDEFAVEAAAMRTVARDLEKLDRLMASQEARLSRALRLLADLRGGFIGKQLRARVDRVIDGKTLALISRGHSGEDQTPEALEPPNQDRSAEAKRCALQELVGLDRYERRAAARRARALHIFFEQKK